MDKICNQCKTAKPVEQFYKRKVSKDGYQPHCKSCDGLIRKKYVNRPERKAKLLEKWRDEYTNTKDGLHHVYVCDDIKYAGVTNNPTWRETAHVVNKGIKRENFRVIYSTKNREEALELERLLHDIGYQGRHTNNMYK